MTRTIEDLRAVSDDELIQEHDRLAQSTLPGVNYYLEELARRETRAAGERMEEMTQGMATLTDRIARLTIIITILTAVSVVATVIGVIIALTSS